jgi:hypothetical protein
MLGSETGHFKDALWGCSRAVRRGRQGGPGSASHPRTGYSLVRMVRALLAYDRARTMTTTSASASCGRRRGQRRRGEDRVGRGGVGWDGGGGVGWGGVGWGGLGWAGLGWAGMGWRLGLWFPSRSQDCSWECTRASGLNPSSCPSAAHAVPPTQPSSIPPTTRVLAPPASCHLARPSPPRASPLPARAAPWRGSAG